MDSDQQGQERCSQNGILNRKRVRDVWEGTGVQNGISSPRAPHTMGCKSMEVSVESTMSTWDQHSELHENVGNLLSSYADGEWGEEI